MLHETPEPTEPATAPEEVVPLQTEGAQCPAGDYYANRDIPAAGGQEPCVKTWDYLQRRTLPTVESPVPAGASLEYSYEYDAAGSFTDTVRIISGPEVPEPETPEGTVPDPADPSDGEEQSVQTLAHAYSYDNLGRLTKSEASDGEVNTYGYDPAGNRTSWNVTGANGGDSKLVAQFNAAGQLTSTTTAGANAGSASYTFDGAGNRSWQTVNGQSTSFGHDPAGRLLSTQADGRATSYAYDGLDRRTTVTDQTQYGTNTTSTVWDGLDPATTDSDLHGTTDLLRDPLGGVIFQDGAYENEWTLGDQRNTTATTDTTGQITDLVDYADFGAADYESTGWASLVGNDGQPGDPTLGPDHYYARDYDTATGSWVQPDQWRGLLTRPQSLNRYTYIENTPVSFSDHLGYVIKAMNMSGGGRSPAKQARLNAFTKAATHSMGTSVRSSAGYKAVAKSNGVISKANIKTPTARSDQLGLLTVWLTPTL